jgi:hypothetical protein
MVRSPHFSEVLSYHCSEDRRLLDFFDRHLNPRRWSTTVLQVGVRDGRIDALLEYHPEATVIVLEPDRRKLRYCKRLFSIGLTESNLPLFCVEYRSYFEVVIDSLPDPHLRSEHLLRTLLPSGVYLSESTLTSVVKEPQ